jgi:hypothetical protein
MPLLHAVGATLGGNLFDIYFGFMAGETASYYGWHITYMKAFLEWLKVTPQCFVTDHNNSPKSALTACYLKVHQRSCIWHTNQDVQV